ncbi:NADH-quinone oxidoreductase subunit L [Paenibacillus selenitireducens]|uniref:NADH-quinone oxidoreductase subunit L n=1 Tax=Paenibacillus selenitireducens TaxID=1324314 RepID=A0A1T2X753_9BACL|nr:NADH-quinone oxidoreductase subunit L [Paenibacillus selenitireducens]OPA75704.1 NADH-quinone oxidoreductase subunit L [Paenibacillus selenitireducens]
MESVYSQYAWVVPIFPMLAFLVLTALGRQMKEVGVWISIVCTFASFIYALLIFIERVGSNVEDYTKGMDWIRFGGVHLSVGFEVTNLNALMLVIVTFVSLLVNIYSRGYMKGDERITVFFAYVSLFTFSMLGLVISSNMLELYIFWELVGVCSFLLVGFWYQKPAAKAAAKKAFIVTRIGDVGLFIAILLLYVYMPEHALDFASIHNVFTQPDALAAAGIGAGVTTLIGILIFVGAIGKSGQFPLHTWLPDAMEGPTPISALIHAATMVAAGVYLVARTFDVFHASPDAMQVVAYVGGFTAIFAATIGIAQNDIKRILAYSTVSQLGYMMMAIGVGSVTAGMFHLFTHAFFKALLFLGAGSVIHMIHQQDIHQMGGLGKKMKVTAWTFGIGALALSGIPPFSGFWSKDAVLAAAWEGHKGLFVVGIIAAFFTAFYMSRLFFLVFTGKPVTAAKDVHESPPTMTIPLVILAVLAVVSGFVYTPFNSWFGTWLEGTETVEHANYAVMAISTIVGLLGIGLGWLIYRKHAISSEAIAGKLPWLTKLLANKYYIDELYHAIIVTPLRAIGGALAAFDQWVIDGIVRGVASLTLLTGRASTRMQNGQVQTYGLITLLGCVLLIVAIVGRRLW